MRNLMSPFNKFHPVVWSVGTFFTLLQFFLQLSSGVVIDLISQEWHLSALHVGWLSGMFYVIYTSLQIPVGILCDRQNPKPILMGSALICGLGCVIFATAHHLLGLYLGRALIALGSAFSFVCLTHLVRVFYPKQWFGILIGTTETLSFFVSVLGIVGLAIFLERWGWPHFMNTAAFLACLAAWLCWKFLPNMDHFKTPKHHESVVMEVLKSIPLWINGLFVGLTFVLVTVFGALWAPPFLQLKMHCSLAQASIMDALFIFGVAISCPAFGYLVNQVKSRRRLVIYGCVLTTVILVIILYMPVASLLLMQGLMLLLGLVSGSYILGYTFANELSPPHALSTTTGMINTLALITTPILQPFIGYVIDKLHTGRPIMLLDYQIALTILPLCIIGAMILITSLNIADQNRTKIIF